MYLNLWYKAFCYWQFLVNPRFRFEVALFASVKVRSNFSMLWPPTRHNKAASSTTLRPPSNYCVLKKDATTRRREESTILNGTGTSLESSHEATSLGLIDQGLLYLFVITSTNFEKFQFHSEDAWINEVNHISRRPYLKPNRWKWV